MENIICPRCGKEAYKNRLTKGVCFNCYRRFGWVKKLITCKRCGKQKPNHAKGYCGGCYQSTFQLEKVKRHNYKKWYGLSLEVYRRLTQTCLICGFDKVIQLHHLDHDHKNNKEDNLIGLCPNHHALIHNLKYKDETTAQIKEKLSLRNSSSV